MSLYKNLHDILMLFYNDETLLRLLYYPAQDLATSTPDPLDASLPNIVGTDLKWSIIDKSILLTSKTDDLDAHPICRLLVYAGNRIPHAQNYLQANQQLVVDVLVHFDFENKDIRTARIVDRINTLLVAERVTGIGKMNYLRGQPISVPSISYVAYRHVYEFGSVRK